DGHCRKRSAAAVKIRLMTLDYVLAHPGERYFGSGPARDEYLTRVFGISEDALPAGRFAVRYRTRIAAGEPPRLTLAQLAESGAPLASFRRCPLSHQALFAALNDCRVVFASDSPRLFSAATAMFERLDDRGGNPRAETADTEGLLEYFRIRRAYEA